MSFIKSHMERLIRERVAFDPYNKEHIEAYRSLREDGRQTHFRFILEYPYRDVVAMMQHKLSLRVVNDTLFPKVA